MKRNKCLFLGRWSQWGKCSVTCGAGTRKRTRSCKKNPRHCFKTDPQEKPCNDNPACQGEWGSWGEWEDCSLTCGEGHQKRFRECPSAEGCGHGDPVGWQNCRLQECTSKLSEWGAWGECSAPCGPGTEKRTRTCLSTRTIPCTESLEESRACEGKFIFFSKLILIY